MDPYSILGLNPGASAEEIKQAYRKLASKHHPDRGGDTKKFQEIQAAYQMLTDPQPQRTSYYGGGFPEHQGGFPGFGGFGANPFQDILNQFHRQSRQKIYTLLVHITLEQSASGEYIDIQVHTETGPKLIKIQVPQGIDSGETVRYTDIMPDGDLQITFKIQSHSQYERKGLDIYHNHSINFLHLILGTKIMINTLSGKNLEINIPPNTQNGTKFRLPGQGISRSGMIGDQYVLINAKLPDKISENLLSAIKQELEQ